MDRRRLMAVMLLGVGGMCAGCAAPAIEEPASPGPSTDFTLVSPAFVDGGRIPAEHATTVAGGRNISVPLEWTSPPAGTQSFAIEVVDMHPMARQWVHWLVHDIPASEASLPSGASGKAMPRGSLELANGFGAPGWGGPQPPPVTSTHEYRFTVYALDAPTIEMPPNASLDRFRRAVESHALAASSIVGTFER